MKKSTALSRRPVSQKAYVRFVERVIQVFADVEKCKAMIAAIDRYLDGDRSTYAEGLAPDCALAFEMLRFDIDEAIARSAKARMRVRKRREDTTVNSEKQKESPAMTDRADDAENKVDDEAESKVVAPLSRRQRRAIKRGLTVRSRWRKLQ